ncbi:MAG: hypothetical protein AAFY69_07615 [Pseudomonadota bacterium]
MFFRKISKQLKKQNWAAIWIDLVIVVVGVYLGIQVDNWNEARNDRDRAQVFAERLQRDLQTDIDRATMRRAFNVEVLDYGREALDWLESEQRGDGGWSVLLALFQASQVAPYRQVNATFEEMRSAGELSLIKDPELRGNLSEYYLVATGSQSDYILRLIPEYRQTIRSLVPSEITRYIWDACHREFNYDDQELIDCESPTDVAEIEAVLVQVAEAPDLLPQLRFWMSTLKTANEMLDLNTAAAEGLIAELQVEQRR